MPIYEYRCNSCQKTFEKLRKFSDAPLDVCEECGAVGQVERVLSTPAFHLKGGGWYKDGYGSGKSSSDTSATKPADAKPASGSGDAKPAATESKPATPSTPAPAASSTDK